MVSYYEEYVIHDPWLGCRIGFAFNLFSFLSGGGWNSLVRVSGFCSLCLSKENLDEILRQSVSLCALPVAFKGNMGRVWVKKLEVKVLTVFGLSLPSPPDGLLTWCSIPWPFRQPKELSLRLSCGANLCVCVCVWPSENLGAPKKTTCCFLRQIKKFHKQDFQPRTLRNELNPTINPKTSPIFKNTHKVNTMTVYLSRNNVSKLILSIFILCHSMILWCLMVLLTLRMFKWITHIICGLQMLRGRLNVWFNMSH